MNRLIVILSLLLAFLLINPVSTVHADFVNGASTSINDLPFLEAQEVLILDKNQDQYFFDPTKSNLAVDDDFTLEAWIKINQFYPGGSWIVTKDNGSSDRQFGLSAADIHKLAFQVKGVGNLNSSNVSLVTNSWTHVAAVWHKSTKNVDFYINGQYDSSSQTFATIPTSGNNAELEIGRREGGLNGTFNGKIAEVRIWNTARNASEIATNYNHMLAGNEPGLLAYYPKWTSTDLNVPYLKQTSAPWNSQIYDSANLWNPSDPSINTWGCALTSAVMVLKFHGINKMLDGITNLDPGTFNTWLKEQPDGYVGNGLVNWLAISRFSKLARGINGVVSYDALEYNRVSGSDTAQLGDDLNHNIPGILEEPGHFIVAKGITQNSFSINDPFFDNRTTLASYSGTFLTLNRFVPSHTNLSYIMIVLDPHIQATLKNASNSAIGQNFIQQPIVNPQNTNQNNGPSKRIIYLQKPADGTYTLTLSGTPASTYKGTIYLYDQDGNVIVYPQEGTVGNLDTETITIKFNDNGNTGAAIKRVVTYQNIIQDITTLRSLGQIKKEKLKTDLITLMQKVEVITQAKKFKKEELKQKFEDFKEDIKKNRKKDMTEQAYQILIYDIQFLKDFYLK